MTGTSVAKVGIGLTNVAATALKARAAEDYLLGKAIDETTVAEAARLAISICDPMRDQRGDAAYKTAMCGEMTRRALQAAHARASKS